MTRFSLSLVSHATPASALTAVDVKIFRHEFITIFRFSEATSLHPADICILEPIDEGLTRYEEENETVFFGKGSYGQAAENDGPAEEISISPVFNATTAAMVTRVEFGGHAV